MLIFAGKVIEERDRIELLRATALNFLQVNGCLEKGSKGYEMMEILCESMTQCFSHKIPLSEDILFICWRWVHFISDGQSLKSEFWKSIKKTVEEVLAIPANPIHAAWFKMNVRQSAVKSKPPLHFRFWAIV